jgi:hypothetical protein
VLPSAATGAGGVHAGGGASEVSPASPPVSRRVTGSHGLVTPAAAAAAAGPAGPAPAPAGPTAATAAAAAEQPKGRMITTPLGASSGGGGGGDTSSLDTDGDGTLPPGWIEAAAEQTVAQWLSEHPDAPHPLNEESFWPSNNNSAIRAGLIAAAPAGPGIAGRGQTGGRGSPAGETSGAGAAAVAGTAAGGSGGNGGSGHTTGSGLTETSSYTTPTDGSMGVVKASDLAPDLGVGEKRGAGGASATTQLLDNKPKGTWGRITNRCDVCLVTYYPCCYVVVIPICVQCTQCSFALLLKCTAFTSAYVVYLQSFPRFSPHQYTQLCSMCQEATSLR